MSARHLIFIVGVLVTVPLTLTQPVFAQVFPSDGASGEPPESINILADLPDTHSGSAEDEDAAATCADQDQAAGTDDEIVVCAEQIDENAFYFSGSREAGRDRYAEETMFADKIPTPNIAGPGIFTGPATVGGICRIGLNPCPPPPAIETDFDALPDAPPDSDAARIAEGLAPLGKGDDAPRTMSDFEKRELGLPPPLESAATSGDGQPEG